MFWPRLSAGADIAGRRAHHITVFWLVATAATTARAEEPAPPYESVVRADPEPASEAREDASGAASVVTPERTPRAAESLAQILGELPGSAVTRLGGLGALATVALRGSTSEQVRVYVDGIPLNAAFGGGVDLSTIPIGDVERVEVYRGMTPIAFGESGIGGVVAVTTRIPRGTAGAVEVGGGSFGTRSAGAQGSWSGRRLRIAAGLHAMASEGGFPFRSDNRTVMNPDDDFDTVRANNALRQIDGLLRFVVPLRGRRELSTSVLGLVRRVGLPGVGTTAESRFDTARLLGSVSYDSADDLGPGGRLRALVYGSVVEQRLHDPIPEVGLIPSETRDRTLSAGASVTGSRPLGTRLRLSGVLEGRQETFLPRNDFETPPEGDTGTRWVGSVGIEADIWWPRLHLDIVPSARLEASRDVTSGRGGAFEALPATEPASRVIPVVRLGLVERPTPGLTFKGNVGRYVRLPSLFELYAGNGYVRGNPALRPEVGVNADLGAIAERSGDHGSLRVELWAFAAWVDDLIEIEARNAQGIAPVGNLAAAKIRGAELVTAIATRRFLRLTGQLTVTDARYHGDIAARRGKPLPYRPPYRAYLRPEVRRLAAGPLELGAYADADLTAGTTIDNAGLVRLPSRLLFGAGAYADAPRWGLRLVVSAQNLAGARVVDLLNYPLPGRSVFATLVWSADNQPKETP